MNGGKQVERQPRQSGELTIIVGAQLAKHLGIADFDVPALKKFMVSMFQSLRLTRRQDTMLGKDGKIDVLAALAQFNIVHSGRKLITDVFSGPQKKPNIKWRPTDQRSGIVIHVGDEDGIMRIERAAFIAWARDNNIPGQLLVEMLVEVYGARAHRVTMGAGCGGYALGQVHCVDIPLKTPELLAYAQPVIPTDPHERAQVSDNPLAHSPAQAVKEGVRRNGLPNAPQQTPG